MTKQELITAIASLHSTLTKSDVESILTSFGKILIKELSTGNSINIGRDIGTFKPVTYTGILPGQPNSSYSSNSVKFKPSAALKRALN